MVTKPLQYKLCKEIKCFYNTTNLNDHLKRKHLSTLNEFLITNYGNQIRDNNQNNEVQITTPNKKLKSRQTQLYITNKDNLSHKQQAKIDNELLNMVCLDFQPLSIVENIEFTQFCRLLQPQYKLPSRKNLPTKLLHDKYLEVLEKLKE